MIELPYVRIYKDRTGKQRQYFRYKGRNTPLPGAVGSSEFNAAYAACRDAINAPAPRQGPVAGTIAEIVVRYYASGKFRNLAAGSKAQYKLALDRFNAEHGARMARQMQAKHIEAVLSKLPAGAAYYLLKRLRTMMKFAVKERMIAADPTAGIDLNRIGEIHTWTDDELRQFEARWPIGTTQRLAYSLMLYTGQRVSDACRMPWPDEQGFRIAQQKTGAQLVVPMHTALAAVLSATKRRHVVLMTSYGRPFTVKGLGKLMGEAIREAGLPARCKTHGLRKAAARRLAEAGATEKQIAAITGHKTLAEVARYTKAADQSKLARQAMAKQVENDGLANPVANATQERQKTATFEG